MQNCTSKVTYVMCVHSEKHAYLLLQPILICMVHADILIVTIKEF